MPRERCEGFKKNLRPMSPQHNDHRWLYNKRHDALGLYVKVKILKIGKSKKNSF